MMKPEKTPRSASLRGWVENRDQGICALCACDTAKALRVMFHVKRHLPDMVGWVRCREAMDDLLQMAGWPRLTSWWWEADHIQALAEGGADSLENMRTLCIPCHRAETGQLKRRLAKAERRRKKGPGPKYQAYQLSRLGEKP